MTRKQERRIISIARELSLHRKAATTLKNEQGRIENARRVIADDISKATRRSEYLRRQIDEIIDGEYWDETACQIVKGFRTE